MTTSLPPHILAEMTTTTPCDNTRVGVIIIDPFDHEVLMMTRTDASAAVAPPSCHIDDHDSPEDAVRTNVEELGLTVQNLTEVASWWRYDVCWRPRGLKGSGHLWTIYTATVTGTLNPNPREARWHTTADLDASATRTIERAHGRLGTGEYAASPGIEPVWVRFLYDLRLVRATADDLAAVDAMAAQTPYSIEG